MSRNSRNWTHIDRSDHEGERFVLMDQGCGCCSGYKTERDGFTMEDVEKLEKSLTAQMALLAELKTEVSQQDKSDG